MMGEAIRSHKCYEAQSEVRSGVWRRVTHLDPLVIPFPLLHFVRALSQVLRGLEHVTEQNASLLYTLVCRGCTT
jgi:hypothetical protein